MATLPSRQCALLDCKKMFVPREREHFYCTGAHKQAAFQKRSRTEEKEVGVARAMLRRVAEDLQQGAELTDRERFHLECEEAMQQVFA